MQIIERQINKDELDRIYDDFKAIEKKDNLPDPKTQRLELVAHEGNEVIGYVSGLTNHRWFYLTDLWVSERYRRKGLGSDLLVRIEDKARSIGMEHIYTWTSGFTNPIFYEKHGYKTFTIFEDFFEVKGYHHIGYRKDL